MMAASGGPVEEGPGSVTPVAAEAAPAALESPEELELLEDLLSSVVVTVVGAGLVTVTVEGLSERWLVACLGEWVDR